MLFCLFSSVADAEAYSGKIVIDGVVVGEGSSNVVSGNGKRSVQTRSLPCFSEITVKAGVDLVIRQGKSCEAKIDADSNLHPVIATDVRGKQLIISANRSFQSQGPVQVEVTTPRLERLEIGGSSDVTLESIRSPVLIILLSGSGEIKGQGQVDQLELLAEGSGDFDLKNLKAGDVHVKISGAADAQVYASRSLKVDIDGAGDVIYYGHPARIEKNISGAGDVEASD
ncbi:MAG: hypothetical protein AXA67_08175 [Methylothermaceae bacteria B42]|nr:MAG: hypothetical protein AXA67_08175 [Methylothermaceae bacteria B42]